MFPTRTAKVFELQDAFAKLAAFAPGDDDGDEGGEGEGEGSSGTGADGDDEGGEASGSDTKKTPVKDPEKKASSDEAAKYRTRARDAEKERDTLKAELQKIADKEKPALELAQRNEAEAVARAEKAEALARTQALRLAMYDSGASALLNRPDQAAKLMDLSEFEPDEDGEVDEKKLLAHVTDWVGKNPHFAAANDSDSDDGDDDNRQPSGRPLNPKKASQKATDRAKLEGKFPALANR